MAVLGSSAEGELRAAVVEALGLRYEESKRLVVEQSPRRAAGDVRFDLTPVLQRRILADDECRDLVAHLNGLEMVEHSRVVAPRVYLHLAPWFLVESVSNAVRDAGSEYGNTALDSKRQVVISYSDPNLNKPLHVGHLRNNFLGMAVSKLLEATGWDVERQASHLNWGLDIAKAVVAYRRWGNGETPRSAEMKPDHFVGRYYLMFHERDEQPKSGPQKSWENVAGVHAARTELELEALDVLARLDRGDSDLADLNQRLTQWAEDGILQTYERVGTRMDALFYEGDHLASGRALVDEMWRRGVLQLRADGSAAVPLERARLGEITFLRADGTPLIYRQWMATDIYRFAERRLDRIIFFFGREWQDGFEIFAEILERLGHDWVRQVEMPGHGMVTRPDGPMQSRSGNFVAADQILDRMAREFIRRWPRHIERTPSEQAKTCETLGVALLKYAFLRVPRKHELPFDEQRVWRNVWPRFAQILRALAACESPGASLASPPSMPDRSDGKSDLIRSVALAIDRFPEIVLIAADRLEPVLVARLIEDLAADVEEGVRRQVVGRVLQTAAATVIRRGLDLLNIELPARLSEFVPLSAIRFHGQMQEQRKVIR